MTTHAKNAATCTLLCLILSPIVATLRAWDRLSYATRDGICGVLFWLCLLLIALFALYGRDVEAAVMAWRLGNGQ